MVNSSRITIPKGFRFHPSDEELLSHYLEKKNHGMDSEISDIIPEIDVCKHDPRDLPALVFARAEFLDREWFRMADSSDMQWYFFSPRGYKYSNSPRTNRTTQQGSWKIQGKDRGIKARGSKAEIGRKRTLTFYQRGQPKAKKTNWVIHEYYLTQASSDPPKQIGDFVLCRLRNKSDDSDHDNKDSPLCDGGEPGSGICSMAFNIENQAAAKVMITEAAEEKLAFKELENFLLISSGSDDDEAEPVSGSYHITASDFENQAAANGMNTEAEEKLAFKELENVLLISGGNDYGEAEPVSGRYHIIASDFESQATPNGMITEAEENRAFKEPENVLLISGGNDYGEAEPVSGTYHFTASDFENQAASDGMITEAEENRAFKELGDTLQIPNGNEDAFNGLQTAGSCLIDNDTNELSNCDEGQPDTCNPSDFDMIEEPLQPHQLPQPHLPQDYRPSLPQSPTCTKLGIVSHTTNVHNDECRKRTYPFGDSDPSLTKKKYISTNDDDELVRNYASNFENQAPYGTPEGYPQSGANLAVFDSFQPRGYYSALPSINGGPRDFSHDNNFIEWDDLLSSFEDTDPSLATFSDTVIDGGSGVGSDRNTEVVHGPVKDHSALAIGATLQCK